MYNAVLHTHNGKVHSKSQFSTNPHTAGIQLNLSYIWHKKQGNRLLSEKLLQIDIWQLRTKKK